MVKILRLRALLVVGIVLVVSGTFSYIAWGTPQVPIGTPGDELAEDNMIAFREAVAVCGEGGECSIDFGTEPPVMIGRYIGGYLISFRTCQTYTCTGIDCICDQGGGDGTFASGFGILIYDNTLDRVSVLIPLDGQDLRDMGHLSQEWMYPAWQSKLLWTKWYLNGIGGGIEGGSGFTYDFAELVGGCASETDPCGRVFLEHLIQLRARSN